MDPDREVDYGFESFVYKPKKRKSTYSDELTAAEEWLARLNAEESEIEAAMALSDDHEEECILEYHGHEYGDYDYDYKAAQKEEDEKYEKMWPAVEILCDSLVRRPREWKIGSHTIKHKPTGQVYWTGTGTYSPITEVRAGSSHTKVFSNTQGSKIRDALNARDIHNPTDEQLAIMKGFGIAPQPFKPEPGFFGRMWAAIKFFPILVKFCVGYRS